MSNAEMERASIAAALSWSFFRPADLAKSNCSQTTSHVLAGAMCYKLAPLTILPDGSSDRLLIAKRVKRLRLWGLELVVA